MFCSVSDCGQRPGAAPAAEREAEQCRAGRQRQRGDGTGVSVGAGGDGTGVLPAEKPLVGSGRTTMPGRCPMLLQGWVWWLSPCQRWVLCPRLLLWCDHLNQGMPGSDSPQTPVSSRAAPSISPAAGAPAGTQGLAGGCPPRATPAGHRGTTSSKYI